MGDHARFVTMGRLLLLLVLAAPSVAAADRLAPHPVREAVVGCWDVRGGARLTVRPLGKHSITYVARFATRPRGGPSTMRGTGTWLGGEFDVACRPRSQHGSFCRISPDPTGVRVRVFALRHGNRSQGRLVEDFVAQRCAR